MVKTTPPPGVPAGPSINLDGVFCPLAKAIAVANMLMPEWGSNLVPVVLEESGGDYSLALDPAQGDYAELVAQQYAWWYIPGVGNAQQLVEAVEKNGVGAPGYFVPANALNTALASTTSTGPLWLSQWNPASQVPMVQSPAQQIAALKAIVAQDLALIAALEAARCPTLRAPPNLHPKLARLSSMPSPTTPGATNSGNPANSSAPRWPPR
jgi:hypothetical protein